MKRIFSILFAVVLVLSFSLIPATPVMANGAPSVTLDIPENVYRPEPFDASSTTTNPTGGTSYTNVRFNITVSGPEAFTGAREDIFTITQVVPGGVQGINETFVLVGGDFVGYWGPEGGFPLPAPYGPITSTFTIQMNDGGTAPVGGYEVTVELVDLTDGTLASATDGFSLSADTLYVGAGLQFTTIQAAVDAASAGDTINVAAGTYTGDITINKDLTLNGANAGTSGSGTRVAESTIVGKVKITASEVTFDGFTVTNSSWLGIEIPRYPSVTDCTISNNIIKACWHGLNLQDSYNNVITRNMIEDNRGAGIIVFNFRSGGGNTITYNTIRNNGDGIQLLMTSGDVINYNSIVGNTYNGVSSPFSGPVNATMNWWGDCSGPYHWNTNPNGSGDSVSVNVDYDPWLGQQLCALKVEIAALSDDDFTKPKAATDQRQALLDKVDAVCDQYDDGAYRGALNKLERDVIKKLEKWIVPGTKQTALIAKVNAEISILNGFLQ